MNELIKELAEKAAISCGYFIGPRLYMTHEKEMAKFAELIVQECVVCAEREWIRNGDTEHNRAVTKVIESIKQHFGVEE